MTAKTQRRGRKLSLQQAVERFPFESFGEVVAAMMHLREENKAPLPLRIRMYLYRKQRALRHEGVPDLGELCEKRAIEAGKQIPENCRRRADKLAEKLLQVQTWRGLERLQEEVGQFLKELRRHEGG